MLRLPSNVMEHHEDTQADTCFFSPSPKLSHPNCTPRFSSPRPRMDASRRDPGRSLMCSDFDRIAGIFHFRRWNCTAGKA